MITKFKIYNESLRYKLKGKSEKEIKKSVEKLDTLSKINYVINRRLPKKYMPSDKEIIDLLKNTKKHDIKLLLTMYKKIKKIDNRKLLHFLNDHDVFTVRWYVLEYVLDERLGEGNYDDLYNMSLDDQIDFIENNTRLDMDSLIDISIEIILFKRTDEKFEEIKNNILKEIS